MGNALSGTSNRLGGAGELMFDSQLQYESSMGSSRFLRATRVRHALGPLVVKTFIKPDPSMRLRRFVRRLKGTCAAHASGARGAERRAQCADVPGGDRDRGGWLPRAPVAHVQPVRPDQVRSSAR